jgi:hypothetical protein
MGAAGQAQREARRLRVASQPSFQHSQEFMDADTCVRANTLCDFGARLRHPHLGELLFPLRLPGYSIRRTACNQRLEVGDAFECLILPIFLNQGANSAQAQQHLRKIPQRSAREEFILRDRESNAHCRSEQVGACAHSVDLRLNKALFHVERRCNDADRLDEQFQRDYDIELIAPNRENRSKTQDRRKLRRYKRRWRVERLFAWL